jgi:hypothetical protein
MNLEETGLTFCRIVKDSDKENKDKNKKSKYISNEPDDDLVREYLTDFKCIKGEKLQLCPVKQKERDILYIAGQSGSGKSYFSNQYIKEYKKLHPKNKVFLFSVHESDKSLSDKNFLKIPLDADFLSLPLTKEDFTNSLTLFDDIDSMKKSKIKTKLEDILRVLLETGRHVNASVIYISHIANKGNETKCILNECSAIVIFPKRMSCRALKYLLSEYVGMNKDQIKRAKNVNSRAITIFRSYPNIVIGEKECYVLDNY